MADYGLNRRSVWRRTGRVSDNNDGQVIEPTGYDLVTFGGREYFEPAIDLNAIRKDGKVTDHQYVGIYWLDAKDTVFTPRDGVGIVGLKPFEVV